MEKKSAIQVPCYCEKCNGAFRSRRTKRKHRAKARNENIIKTTDFLEWQRTQTKTSSRRVSSQRSQSSGSEETEPDSSDGTTEWGRPHKRSRSETDTRVRQLLSYYTMPL